MNVVVCGGINCDEIVSTIARGFQRLDWGMRYVATRKAAGHHELRTGAEAELEQAMRQMKPELLVWVLCKQDCTLDTIRKVRAASPETKLVFHSFDDPYQHDVNPLEQPAWFDFAVTCCESSIEWYAQKRSVKAICLWPPCDVDFHGRAQWTKAVSCDFSFIATNVYPKCDYPAVLAERRDLAHEAVKIGDLHLYGCWDKRYGWGGEFGCPELQSRFKGWASYWNAQPSIYASTKVNLNSHVRPDGLRYFNERVFNVLGSGGFLLTDYVNGMETVFDVGKELDTWKTLDEFKDKATWWLKHEVERKQAAKLGQVKALMQYNNREFARRLAEFCGVK